MSFRIAKDKWTSRERTFARSGPLTYDKLQHFIGGALFFSIGAICHPYFGLAFSMSFWFIWEIKDALIPWENRYETNWPIRYNWGGDGFSWRDMIAAWAGALITFTIGITL